MPSSEAPRQPARVEASPQFLEHLGAAHRFFALQDPETADARLQRLKSHLRQMVQVLQWSPGIARPARLLNMQTVQGRLQLATVRRLAAEAGMAHLREYVVEQHIVLYAHSDTDVALLALKHQKQLLYPVFLA